MRPGHRASLVAAGSAVLALAACEGPPAVPLHPTWSDVAPILQGECNHCHGATARTTGSSGPAVYRFDFFDMNDAVCGDAAAAMETPALAAASAAQIKTDITWASGVRPRMPPAPAAVLQDWERDTLLRWAEAPTKGAPPLSNRPPRIQTNLLPASAKGQLAFVATTDDPDHDSVVGVIRLGDMTVKMDHPGSFEARFNLSGMSPGTHRLTAVLCDGWGSVEYDLGPVRVEK